MPFRKGQKVNAYFESSRDPTLNGFYPATITKVIEQAGFATRYDIFYDDED
jgi:hypothetical protein